MKQHVKDYCIKSISSNHLIPVSLSHSSLKDMLKWKTSCIYHSTTHWALDKMAAMTTFTNTFFQRKVSYFDAQSSLKFVPKGWTDSIGSTSSNGLVPSSLQAITWTIVDQVLWCHVVSLGLLELRKFLCLAILLKNSYYLCYVDISPFLIYGFPSTIALLNSIGMQWSVTTVSLFSTGSSWRQVCGGHRQEHRHQWRHSQLPSSTSQWQLHTAQNSA